MLKLRTFSRLDEGERKPASIRDGFGSALTILNHRLEGRIQVMTELGEPDVIHCYAGLLNQAIMNLLTNAIDAIQGPGTIHVQSGAEGEWYVIRIQDSGPGIPDDIREQVFNPFFTTKPVGEGTGLGLSITYSIIKKHDGTIALDRAEGGGTVATIRLPLAVA